MKAIATIHAVLHDIELPMPQPRPRELEVQVEAISVNPVDHKQRSALTDGDAHVLGWDVAGTVSALGEQAGMFKVGDALWYAGSIARPGANSQYHAVDERLVARRPASLSASAAAALPLTTITAWEALFERLGIVSDGSAAGQRILIIGGAGGVGSIAIQLAARVARLEVIATASRPESAEWCRRLGATHVIDHNADMAAQMAAAALPAPEFIFNLTPVETPAFRPERRQSPA